MGSCGISKRSKKPDGSLVRKITITPSQFVSESHSRFSQFYKIGNRLGGGTFLPISPIIGAFGEVYVCYHRQAGFARAVKVLSKTALGEAELERLHREIDILKIMDHPNIVRLFETYSDSKHYYLVTEYGVR